MFNKVTRLHQFGTLSVFQNYILQRKHIMYISHTMLSQKLLTFINKMLMYK